MTPIRYRIAYLAACIEDSPRGHALRDALEAVAALDPSNVQFGSADWFWEQWPNSYVLQVEPAAQRFGDQATLAHAEALHVETLRGTFFDRLRELVAAESPVRG